MMKIHPFANLFPMCSEEEIQELADDIKLHGLREPIVTDEDDTILDGRHRFLACEIAGVKPVYAPFPGNEDEKLAFVVSANIHRRHLSQSQKSMICAKLKVKEDELAAERKKRKAKSVVENLPPQKTGKARDTAGEALGVSGKSVDMAVKVQTQAVPEIIAAVESGELAVSAAAIVADMPKDQQQEIVSTGGTPAVKAAAAKQRKNKAAKKAPAKAPGPAKGDSPVSISIATVRAYIKRLAGDDKHQPKLKELAELSLAAIPDSEVTELIKQRLERFTLCELAFVLQDIQSLKDRLSK